MKIKATKKEIKTQAARLYSVGYCGASELLRDVEPFAYSAGVYGWACDYYDLDGVIISTGYNPIGAGIDGITAEFEKKARKISEDYGRTWKERAEAVREIRAEWIAELKTIKTAQGVK